MPLTFLVPALLAGLAAVVVPIVLHLRRRERERPTRFPSLMFLQQVSITTARRRRITDWPLLLLRAAIVSLLVLAFARPVVRPQPHALPVHGSRRVVIALDRSMSMGHRAVWAAAVDSARDIVQRLTPGDRVAVIAFDAEATVEQPLSTDHGAALAAIARIHPGALATRYAAAIRAAREVLDRDADHTGGEVLVVTDLQRTGMSGVAGSTLPASVTVRAIDAARHAHGNSAIVGIEAHRVLTADTGRGRLAIAVQVAAKGLSVPRRARVTLTVNGRVAGSAPIAIPAEGTATAEFTDVPVSVGSGRVLLTLDHDSLPADDEFHAVMPAQLIRRVIEIVPADLAPDETLYLEQAIETGNEPALRLERRNAAALTPANLHDALAVLLYDVPPPAGAAGTALAAYVHDGGGLIAVAGRRTAVRASTSSLLPGTLHGMVDRTADNGGVLGTIALAHPIFAPFRGRAAASLSVARFFRYARITSAPDAQVLARFDDDNPALVERQDGAGHVLLLGMPLDATSADFPLQPTYLPFLRGMVLHAGGDAESPLWYTAGDIWTVPGTLTDPVVLAPSGQLLRPEPHGGVRTVALDEAGFYTAYEGRATGDPVTQLAVNPAPRESDLSRMPASGLLVGVRQDSVTASTLSQVNIVDAERRQRIWRMLLILAALALLVEGWITSRGWRGAAATIVGVPEKGVP